MKPFLHLLVVDDVTFFRELLVVQLKEANLPIKVDKASNGEEAIEKVGPDHPYDAILMNIQMPLIDGLEATRILRRRGIKVPIIPWSAHSKLFMMEKCEEAGMNDYIEMSINVMDDMLRSLKQVGVPLPGPTS